MKKTTLSMRILSVITMTILTTSVAFSQTVTPTATATPSACQSLQTCVDQGVTSTVSSCVASNPNCETKGNTDKYAISAGELAKRSIANSKCSTRKNKGTCNLCYNIAKVPLQARFKGNLFKGLLAQAVSIVEQERKTVCSALPTR